MSHKVLLIVLIIALLLTSCANVTIQGTVVEKIQVDRGGMFDVYVVKILTNEGERDIEVTEDVYNLVVKDHEYVFTKTEGLLYHEAELVN